MSFAARENVNMHPDNTPLAICPQGYKNIARISDRQNRRSIIVMQNNEEKRNSRKRWLAL
jgi:hypothetical protein